jgi:hypothetical protein
MKRLLLLIALAWLTACAAPQPPCPDGREGGIGGTGLCPTDAAG